MDIKGYELNLDISTDKDINREIQLIYRGNENIIIRFSHCILNDDDGYRSILVPRNVLEKFMELINEV